jgi:hypothetical protein
MPVPPSLQPFVQPLEVALQLLRVLLLRDAITPHSRILADPMEGPSQRIAAHRLA